jgi:HEAT repeat protein
MTNITPRYAELFAALLDSNQERADKAFDDILFDRQLAVPALIEQLLRSKDNHNMRYFCVQLLGFSESPLAIEPILLALQDTNVFVRKEACMAIEDLKIVTADVFEALEDRLCDLNPEVAQAANECIDFLKTHKKKIDKKAKKANAKVSTAQ